MNLLITKAELHIINYKKRRKLHWDSVVLYLAVIQHDNVNNYCQYNPITLIVCTSFVRYLRIKFRANGKENLPIKQTLNTFLTRDVSWPQVLVSAKNPPVNLTILLCTDQYHSQVTVSQDGFGVDSQKLVEQKKYLKQSPENAAC